MRKFILSLWFLSFLVSFSFAQEKVSIKLDSEKSYFEVISKSTTDFTLKTGLNELILMPVSTKGGDFYTLASEGLMKIFDAGMPNIPVISKTIELPQDATVKFNIVSYDEKIYKLEDYNVTKKIEPAQPSVSKSDDIAVLPYYFNSEKYATDDYNFSEIAVFEDLGTMRYIRMGRIEIHPVQYNPVKNEIRVLNNLVIEVVFENADMAKTQALQEKYYTPYFESAKSQAINSIEPSKELITDAPVEFLIVSARMFETQLQPFIAWKQLKGFNVTVAYTDVIGTTTTAIKTYIQNQYNGSNPPVFVLLCGDVAQIPAWPGNDSHITDLRYFEFTGDDVPEVCYGRFSASTTAQMQPQIDKTLEYEKYLMADPSYLAEVVMIAGDDSSYEMVYGNGQINYGTTYYFNSSNDITSHTYLQPLDNSAASTQIKQNISSGVGYANYTAHCSESGWATPSFVTSDVPSLTNAGKYGLLVGNCCLSNAFDTGECFGESLLRAQNKGSIGYIGGSNSTYWDEDYYWGCGSGTAVQNPVYANFGTGAYDGMFHNLANEVNNLSKWYITQSQMNLCGQLAVNSSTSTMKEYYWEIYHLMGDPTLMPYMGVPDALPYTFNPDVLLIGSSSVEISTVPYAYIAMHQGGNRIVVASADANGDATLNFSSNLTGGDITLVITAQNRIPVNTTITPIAADAPYVLVNSYTPGTADFNSSVTLNVTLENVATAGSGYDATGVTSTLSTSDTYVTITDASANFGNIIAGATSTLTDAFAFQIADNVPDGHVITFTITSTGNSGTYTWDSQLNITANAPLLQASLDGIEDIAGSLAFTSTPVTSIDITSAYNYDVVISEVGGNNNGLLDAGESVVLVLNTANNGHADLVSATCTLTSTSQYVTVNTNEVYISSIAVGAELPSEFNIEIDPTTPVGTTVDLLFTIVYAGYEDVVELNLPVGLQIEDFESGDFSSYNWLLTGNTNWLISSTSPYEGTKCAVSGDITASQTSSLEITCNVTEAGVISFWYKVSSESGYDYLKFYINGTLQGSGWSGTVGWTEATYNVTAGSKTFKWVYSKDGSVDSGSDCAWIDFITFPGFSSKSGEKSTTISATTLPAWLTFGDNGDGTASLTGTSPNTFGTHPVVISATNGTDTKTQEFSIQVGIVSLSDIISGLNIYPNPSNGMFNIEISKFNNASVTIQDLSGRVILSQKLNAANTTIDLSSQAKGLYLINVNADNQTFNSKVVLY